MSEKHHGTKLTFRTQTILDAALFVFNLTVEGPNNHKIVWAETMDEIDEVTGTVGIGVPDTASLRLWVETKANGVVKDKFKLVFETAEDIELTPTGFEITPARKNVAAGS